VLARESVLRSSIVVQLMFIACKQARTVFWFNWVVVLIIKFSGF